MAIYQRIIMTDKKETVNESTVIGLEFMVVRLNEMVDEVHAWNRLLKYHTGQQKKHTIGTQKGSYRYNPKTKKLERLDEEGNLIKSY